MEPSTPQNSEFAALEIARIFRERAAKQLKIDTVLKTYVTIGLLIALGATIYFFLSAVNFLLDPNQLFAVTIGGVSLILSAMSFLLLVYRRQRLDMERVKSREYYYIGELIQSWADFESVSKRSLDAEREKFNRYSLRSIISLLAQEGKISQTDVLNLQEALTIRNTLVHGNDEVPAERIQAATGKLTDVTTKLLASQRDSR